MADYSSLPTEKKAIYIENVLFTQYGITSPGNTTTSKEKLQAVIEILRNERKALTSIANSVSSVTGATFDQAISAPVPYSQLPPQLQTQLNRFVPPGYTVNQISIRDIDNALNVAITNTLDIRDGRQQLPVMGATVNFNVTNTTPAINTTTLPALPTNITPATTTAPSSSTISNILTAAAVIGGGALIVNALNNRVQNSTATPVPPADNPNPIPASTAAFDDANASPQSVIDPNSDPNTNIGAEGQDVTGFEPLTEPPITNDGDEFSGIDEQIQRQKDLEDGSLEFAGIDDQIAANENTLQEPPLLSDEEIEQQLRLAAAQEETIAPQKEVDEFDGIDAQIAANKAQADLEAANAANAAGNSRGLSTSLQNTRSQATQQDVANFQAKPDWRVRLSLAPGATYLYKNKGKEGILLPLAATDGVIFPYTPAISVQYAASYDNTELTHSNYKFFTYRGSAVDSISISCDFTAQDTFEANYLLAVIHFFRSVTKMFYGQDQNPKIGTPPPLCYLSGLGAFQFDAHPLAITTFNYTLPTEVDYIRAGSTPTPAGVNRSASNVPLNSGSVSNDRLNSQGLNQGGLTAPPQFNPNGGTRDVTYVPTKMQIQISAVPIVTRNDISNKFSLTEYGTGKLLRGTQRQGGGIW